MEPLRPSFPITYCAILRGWPWSRQRELYRERYDDLLSLEDDFERIDTRGDPNSWIEDSTGKRWDVSLDILFGEPGSAQFYVREEP